MDVLQSTFSRMKLFSTELFSDVKTALEEARTALIEGKNPRLFDGSMSGTYFLHGLNVFPIAIFKPIDEEPGALNNPHGILSTENMPDAVQDGHCLPGEAALKEVAAYLLDTRAGTQFSAGVPACMMVSLAHSAFYNPDIGADDMKEKEGSFQVYATHDCESWDVGPSIFPVSQVHSLGIFDLRVLNCDRHGGNILVRRGGMFSSTQLIPIDHQYILPRKVCASFFEWLNFPQAKQPFDEATKQFIASLDPEEDVKYLRKHLKDISNESLLTMRATTMLLQRGTAAGLTLYHMGMLMAPSHVANGRSVFEEMCLRAEDDVNSCIQLLQSSSKYSPRQFDDDDGEDKNKAMSDSLYEHTFLSFLSQWIDWLLSKASLMHDLANIRDFEQFDSQVYFDTEGPTFNPPAAIPVAAC
eukprot:GFYU01001305.1.p1 GENE.GFYU01001305.1~~GFYU01001305.1.p1  ORF type:complete len:413 (+),score=129.18 GFYU01001305.1:646-1884(+)